MKDEDMKPGDFKATFDFGGPELLRTGKQPPRGPGDGMVRVYRIGASGVAIASEQNGVTTEVRMSAFNAWRAFGMLSMALGIRLPAKLGKTIKL